MKFKSLFAILTFMLIFPLQGYSGMYKYQDENGTWVYSQHPPAEGDYITIKAEKAPRSSNMSNEARNESIAKSRESVIGNPADNKAKGKAEAETAKNEAKRKDSCEKSKTALSGLQIYRRFRAEDGTVSSMDDVERQNRIKTAKQNVSQFCD